MKSRTSTFLIVTLFTLLGINIGYVIGQSPWAPVRLSDAWTNPNHEVSLTSVQEVWDLVQLRYYQQPIDTEALLQGAMDGMLAVLEDPYTRYLPPEDEVAARERMSGEFQGIGAEVESVDGVITVVAPIDGSPAAAAGVRTGDILRQADGVELTGMDVQEAARLVRGPAGTAVTLLIERDGNQFTLTIVRDVIKLASVRGEVRDDGIAYLRLSQFGDQSADELEAKLTELLAQNPTGLVLDLRQNPGGGLNTAVTIADQFLPAGRVLIERFGNEEDRIFESQDGEQGEAIPLVVLVDEGSASAAEVLAGAIQDRGRGILIGQTTFGKGTVQTWQSLSNGGGVRLTIARWLTPNERWINETGLTPEYFIPLPEASEGGEFVDTQLQAAVDYLLGRPIISVPPTEPDQS